MKKLFFILALLPISSFAQQYGHVLNRQIEDKVEKLRELVQFQRAHESMRPEQKAQLVSTLDSVIYTIQANTNPYPNPNPYPTPYPTPAPPYPPHPGPGPGPGYGNPAQCSWFDGQSKGIAQRGVHAFRIINGIYFSLGFYENNGNASLSRCNIDVVFKYDAEQYRFTVGQAARSTCACAWFDGESNGIGTREYHMFYKVPHLLNGSEIYINVGNYGNNGTSSQQACNQRLVLNNFMCPINH